MILRRRTSSFLKTTGNFSLVMEINQHLVSRTFPINRSRRFTYRHLIFTPEETGGFHW
jgi:hypothetical protein